MKHITKYIYIIFIVFGLSACASKSRITIKDDAFEFKMMHTTVNDMVENGYEICTVYGEPYTDLTQHVIQKKTWSSFHLYKDDVLVGEVGILNNTTTSQELKDGVIVSFRLIELSNIDHIQISDQSISTVTLDQLFDMYPDFKFKEQKNKYEDRESYMYESGDVVVTFTFHKDGDLLGVSVRSLKVDFSYGK